MKADVIIIGGGASGLVAAIACARYGSKVTILEHKDKIGKKILATGNGRCNYTNLSEPKDCYRGEDSSFARKVLSNFSINQTIDFFKELGIYPKSRDGYLYPNSDQASSILDVLTMELIHLKVNMICNEKVVSIVNKNNNFYIKTTNENYQCKKLILATGGKASSDLGSDGSGYILAEGFGHTIVEPVAALVQLKSDASFFKTLAGVRVNANMSLFINNILKNTEYGELQLTKYGVSGIPIFQLSRYASKAVNKQKKVHLLVDFIPEITSQDLLELITYRTNHCPYKTIEEIFIGLINNKIAYVILKESNINPETLSESITKKDIIRIVTMIKEFYINITEPNSFSSAQVCAGGVLTKEIKADSLESTKQAGLYIVGELLDIDGICGGYNLQWAWSSGYLAGSHAGSKTS